MNTLTTKYGKLYAFTIAIFFTFSIFFGVSTFYPEPDYNNLLGEEPSYPIQHDNMTKEEKITHENTVEVYRVAQETWWDKRELEKESYEGKVLLFFAPICLLFMLITFKYKEFPPPIRLGLFGGPVLALLMKLLPYLGSVWAGARFLVALTVFVLLVIAGTPSLRKKIKSITTGKKRRTRQR